MLAVGGVERHLLEVGEHAGRAGVEHEVHRRLLGGRGEPVEAAERGEAVGAHGGELLELVVAEAAGREDAVEEGPLLGRGLGQVTERLQGGDPAAQFGVGGVVEADVDGRERADALGEVRERGGPGRLVAVGLLAHGAQPVQLAQGAADLVAGRFRDAAVGRDQPPDHVPLVVHELPRRSEFGAEAEVSAEHGGGDAALGLQFVHEVLDAEGQLHRA